MPVNPDTPFLVGVLEAARAQQATQFFAIEVVPRLVNQQPIDAQYLQEAHVLWQQTHPQVGNDFPLTDITALLFQAGVGSRNFELARQAVTIDLQLAPPKI